MKTLVMGLLYQLPGQAENRIGDGLEMLDLWTRHLRGPGEYQGDVRVITNLESIGRSDLSLEHLSIECQTISDAQSLKGVTLCGSAVNEFDSVLYLDLDILAISPISELFARDDSLRAARSSISMLDARHAGNFLSPAARYFYRLFPRSRRDAANTCAVSFCPEHRSKSIDEYAQAIDEARSKNARLPLGDQTVFNWCLWSKKFAASLYPRGWIQHSRWQRQPGTILWHFPASDRLNVMKRLAIV